MHRLAIHVGNGAWLIVVLVGVPAVTSMQLGELGLSSLPEFRMLTLAGMAAGAAGNLVCGWLRVAKPRKLWWHWTFVYVAGLGVYLLMFSGHLRFGWLKEALLWLKRSWE